MAINSFKRIPIYSPFLNIPLNFRFAPQPAIGIQLHELPKKARWQLEDLIGPSNIEAKNRDWTRGRKPRSAVNDTILFPEVFMFSVPAKVNDA
jgi:hypothetical protein